MKQNIIDRAQFVVKGGDGGNGAVSFRREKYVPKGGPDGGDGGRGGSVHFLVNENIRDLRQFAGKDRFEADGGERGGRRQCTGLNAEDIVIEVPVGTEVWVRKDEGEGLRGHKFYGDMGYRPIPGNLMPRMKRVSFEDRWVDIEENDGWVKVADLQNHNEKLLIAQGGEGGRGNEHFKSSALTTPKFAEEGEKGEWWKMRLELKVLADVGLIGLPNAGKSTLLSVLTAARPEIADYPFTTLTPNLGVMDLGHKNLVLADIPGLIEDAHKGKGLGHEFLKHIERCKILVHLVAPELVDGVGIEKMWTNYLVVKKELEQYSEILLEKRELVVVNKIDLIQDAKDEIKEFFKNKGLDVVMISAATGEGLEELKRRISEFV